jgi:hypothetical protein
MWTYSGLSYPNRPSFVELSAVEVETWIHMVLDLGVNRTPMPALCPYGEGSLVSGLVH